MKHDAINLAKAHAAVPAKQLIQSVPFLMSKRADLQQYESVEDLVFAEVENPAAAIRDLHTISEA